MSVANLATQIKWQQTLLKKSYHVLLELSTLLPKFGDHNLCREGIAMIFQNYVILS